MGEVCYHVRSQALCKIVPAFSPQDVLTGQNREPKHDFEPGSEEPPSDLFSDETLDVWVGFVPKKWYVESGGGNGLVWIARDFDDDDGDDGDNDDDDAENDDEFS